MVLYGLQVQRGGKENGSLLSLLSARDNRGSVWLTSARRRQRKGIFTVLAESDGRDFFFFVAIDGKDLYCPYCI